MATIVRVITYGTYDLLHHGHRRLLERAKALGDYLIVGVTADDFDKKRGKINVQQSLMERIEGVKSTGLADEIIVEEYEGQKIDDIRRYSADIFTVGSDWVGKFDYLNDYCQVIYLPRTEGVSSSEVRAQNRRVRLGLVGESDVLKKFRRECEYVNGVEITGICSQKERLRSEGLAPFATKNYEELLERVDAVYIISHPRMHGTQIRRALESGKHVLCESPIALSARECTELFQLAEQQHVILMEAIKTAYSTAYNRLLLLAKSGQIGQIVSVDATCTKLASLPSGEQLKYVWNSICAWGPQALLPVFQLLGTQYMDQSITTCLLDEDLRFDKFTKIDFTYPAATATIKVGKGIKSEGELIVSGTEGYIYVPAPWWKTDYFELRYEKATNNKRYFYQLDGEGIRYEVVSFLQAIESGKPDRYISQDVSKAISTVIESFETNRDVKMISFN